MAKEIIKNAETMTAEAQEAIQEQLNFDGAEVVGTTAQGADAEEKEVDTSAKPKPALVNTLITLETYHDYQTKLEAIDDLIMRAFKSSRHPVKIKVIMEEDLNNERE